MIRVSEIIPPFEAAYAISGAVFGDRKGAIEEMLIIEPAPVSIMQRMECLLVKMTLFRSVRIMLSQYS